MARTLTLRPPSSSVARLLDAESVARALKPVAAAERPSAVAAPCHVEAPTLRIIKREFVLTSAAAETLDLLLERLRAGTQTRLSSSHAIRSLLLAVRPQLSGLDAILVPSRPWKLPPNGEQHRASLAMFEQSLADAIVKTLRNA